MEIKNETFIDVDGELMKRIPVFTPEGLAKELKRQEEIQKNNKKFKENVE
ncbi:hypothetical protein [Staphylococcus equorum]|nr:hypothetical protein [Staphylococcus equorum]MDK9870167.1 hypothetical protein [Staphylococcus equorum]